MGFLKNFLNAQEEGQNKDWQVLDNEAQLEQIVKDSHQKPVVLFKHSIRCGISSSSKHQLESDWDFTTEELDFYYLDLITYRSVSNKITDMFDVIHQSPQVIVIKNGKAVYNTSHHQISVKGLRQAIA